MLEPTPTPVGRLSVMCVLRASTVFLYNHTMLHSMPNLVHRGIFVLKVRYLFFFFISIKLVTREQCHYKYDIYVSICVVTGTGLDWQSCPAGTYSDQESLTEVSQCKPCPGGKYCAGEHLIAYTNDCDPGKLLEKS